MMGIWIQRTMLIAVVGGTAAYATANDGFDRYQVILERQPFGEPEPEPVPPPPAENEIPPWAETYRLCSVYESFGKEIQVALLDTKTNKPVMLKLGGDPVEGIELLAADLSGEEATFAKDGQSVTMKLMASSTPAPRQQAARATTPRGGSDRPVVQPPQRPTNTPPPVPNRPRGVLRSATR